MPTVTGGCRGSDRVYRRRAPPAARSASRRGSASRPWGRRARQPRRVPALKQLWDAPVTASISMCSRSLDAVFLALPITPPPRSARRWSRAASGLRSVRRLPAARSRRCAERWYPHRRTAGRRRLRLDRTVTATRSTALGLVACAGCYPDGGDPRAAAAAGGGAARAGAIIIDAKSGVSGAGKTPTERTHFSESHGSLSAYGVFDHRHAAEIEQELGTPVTFVPHLLPIDRGILETIYARAAARRDRGGDRAGRCTRPTTTRRSCG